MGNEIADSVLVEKVQNGDKKAFDLLVIKYQNRVVNLVSRYVRDITDAQDIAQEAFLKAYRALPNFRGDSAFYTWLYRIAINTAKNHVASRARRPQEVQPIGSDDETYDLDDALKETDTPENLLLTDEIQETILSAIEDLPEDLRTAITLREVEGLSYDEIAEAMTCPIGTVRSRIFRAREAIDVRLKPLLE
ncbi:MAG: RNA polymerase sigma factor RpoE [Gammaproteobacteria bacterium]